MKKLQTIAIIGNPNVGKTTLFNLLTGSRYHVGNWPGVTVDKKYGSLNLDQFENRHKNEKELKNKKYNVVDLPGVYNLSSVSPEEIIAHTYIVKEKPDVVIDVVDGTNLERNLYLALELLEMGVNTIIALNMMDTVNSKGIKIDIEKLKKILGVPVIPIVASTGRNIDQIFDAIIDTTSRDNLKKRKPMKIEYGDEIEKKLESIEKDISKNCNVEKKDARWLSVYYLLGDTPVLNTIGCNIKKIREEENNEKENNNEEVKSRRSKKESESNYVIKISDARYGFIRSVILETVKRSKENRKMFSDVLDGIVLNKWLSIPIFLVVMYLVYFLAFDLSSPFGDWISSGMGYLSQLTNTYVSGIIGALVGQGILPGVGNVLIFIPTIFILFLVLGILEDFGYMSRAAFVADRLMSKVNLHGKSFISFILGFGCNVPAIMSTRSIENKNERLLTILINPLIPCSARILIFIFIASIFFSGQIAGIVVLSLILLGVLLAISTAYLFSKTILKKKGMGFIIELPMYQTPSAKTVTLYAWDKTKRFIIKAGTVIFVSSIVIWALSLYPSEQNSYIMMLGKLIQPIFAPLGFDWKLSVALLTGFAAKEIVISTLGVLFASGGKIAISTALQSAFPSIFHVYGFLVFTLIYTPCLATVAVIKQETGKWKWALFTIAYSFTLAWVLAYLVITIGPIVASWI